MAIFSKEPPKVGVSKFEKRSFFNCLTILFNKLGTLIRANMLFALTLVPLLALCVVVALIVFPDTDILHTGFKFNFIYQLMLIPLPLAFCGPSVAALTKLTRDIGRGEHIFVVKDFFAVFKRCFLKATAASVIAYVFYVAAFFALMVYWGTWVLFAVAAIATMYFTVMLNFVFLMTVSLKLSVFKMFKNAFFLILVSFKKCFAALIFIIIAAVLFATNFALTVYVNIGVIFLAADLIFIQFALPQLFIDYYLFDVIIKQVVEPFYAENKNSASIAADDACEIKNNEKNVETEQSDYIYENGKLVKKSVYESERIFSDEN